MIWFNTTEAFKHPRHNHWRAKAYHVIFGTESRAGRRFDLILLCVILTSVAVVMLESVSEIRTRYGSALRGLEWFFTGLFLIEYVFRILSVRRPIRYIFSFFGLIDLLAILPTFLAIILPASSSLLVIRILRLIRVFRILKMVAFVREAQVLVGALRASRRKITVFLTTILSLVVILGTVMYLIEGGQSGFTSIPRSIYWAIVTLTTVGYGDIAPTTAAGQALAAFIMILGYSIIAVPTGIVTTAMFKSEREQSEKNACSNCGTKLPVADARFCHQCGTELSTTHMNNVR